MILSAESSAVLAWIFEKALAAANWTLYSLHSEIVERARLPFPHEPVRSLDALHLAAALVARDIRPQLAFLSLDQRLRENAAALGFEVVPDGV